MQMGSVTPPASHQGASAQFHVRGPRQPAGRRRQGPPCFHRADPDLPVLSLRVCEAGGQEGPLLRGRRGPDWGPLSLSMLLGDTGLTRRRSRTRNRQEGQAELAPGPLAPEIQETEKV